jgi:catecholate siderophore receptor
MQSKFKPRPLTIAVLLSLGAHPSFAADTEKTVDAGAANDETLPEVKVAAPRIENEGYKAEKASSSKFTAPLIDTPKSVTVIPESVIQDTGSVTLQDALRTVPGITFGAAEGGGSIGDRPFIRGFDSQSAMYVDGVRDIGGQTREIFDIESIEVLKGPSGAFDGRGSGGGSINLVSKQPKAENFIAGSVGLGTDQYKRITADGNYMLNEDIAFRLNVMGHKADIPGRDEVDVKRWGFAPSITFGINSPTSLNLSYYHLQTDDMPDYGLPYTFTGATQTLANQNRNANGDRPANVDKDNFYGLTDRDFRKTDIDITTATFKHAFSDDVVLKNTTRYGEATNQYVVTVPDDSRGNVQNGFVSRSAKQRNATTRTITNVTDLSVAFDTGSIAHKVNTGIEFSHEQTRNHPYLVTPGTPGLNTFGACNAGTLGSGDCTSLSDPDPDQNWTGTVGPGLTRITSRNITQAAYAFDSIELSKKWLLNVGVRRDNYSSDTNTRNLATGAVTNKFSLDEGFWNYQAGVVYKLQPNASIYASYGTSSTPVGSGVGNSSSGDNISLATSDLQAERTKSYEIGTKWDVLENLALTSAIFHTTKDNARVAVDPTTTVNAGEQRVNGFEIGAAGKITNKWQVFGGYTYLDAEVVDNGDALGTNGNLNASEFNGNRFPQTAKNSASLWSTYAIWPNLTVGGGAFYVGKQYGNVNNTVSIASYVRLDAVGTYQIDKNLSLQLNIQNLTDKRYFDSAYTTHYATVAPGRLGFLTLNFKY